VGGMDMMLDREGLPLDDPRAWRSGVVAELGLAEGGSPDSALDSVVALASTVTGWPIAAMTFVDDERQWWPASTAWPWSGSSREHSICARVIESGQPVLVHDLSRLEHLAQVSLVATGQVGAYAGVPVVCRDGVPLASLCVMRPEVGGLEPERLEVLRGLAQLLAVELETRLQFARRAVRAETRLVA